MQDIDTTGKHCSQTYETKFSLRSRANTRPEATLQERMNEKCAETKCTVINGFDYDFSIKKIYN
jgi:hypothetical protein